MTARVVPETARIAGIITTPELARAGVTPGRIRSLVRQQVLIRVGWGVYARADAAARLRGGAAAEALRIAAALAVTGPDAVGSHRSAALVHGMDLLTPDRGAVTVTQPVGSARRVDRSGIRVHVATLPAGHVTTWQGLPVTSPARTVADLARTSSFRAGVVCADSALHGRLVTRAQFDAVLAGCARWPGVGRAREVVEFSDSRPESALESLSRVVFDEQGLPPPDLQVWVGDGEGPIGRVDFLWRRFQAIAEADGRIKYTGAGRAMAQLRRDARLRRAGYEVIHFTWQEIMYTPERVVADIRAAFQRGTRLRGTGAGAG